MALKLLRLDEVWWLVSPQNPLKSTDGMATFEKRMDAARAVATAVPRIHVSDVEAQLGTRYTADTLEKLVPGSPSNRFVWLMGADNLSQIHHWRDWSRIFRIVPVAVFGRPGYSLRATWPQGAAKRLVDADLPAWVFLKIREHSQSASKIRAQGGF
jgi:nicotinate-nucleotide adenylyltransferase